MRPQSMTVLGSWTRSRVTEPIRSICSRSREERANSHVPTSNPNAPGQLGGTRTTVVAGVSSATWDPADGTPGKNARQSKSTSMTNSTSVKPGLDWQPVLTTLQEGTCFLLSCVVCGITYFFTAPAKLNVQYAAGIAIICAVLTWAFRMVLLERQYEARAKSVTELGDNDSRFLLLGQLHVHAKAYASEQFLQRLSAFVAQYQCSSAASTPTLASASQPGQKPLEVIAIHCYHGFGANLYSYKPVQAGLAEALNGIATSHDMPGFGLTERPSDTSSYFLSFNGHLGSQLVEHEVARLVKECAADQQKQSTPAITASPPMSTRPQQQAAHTGGQEGDMDMDVQARVEVTRKPTVTGDFHTTSGTTGPQLLVRKVLIGHSLGGICAALAALENPEQISALVLVAPAILALPDRQVPLADLQPWQPPADIRSHPIVIEEMEATDGQRSGLELGVPAPPTARPHATRPLSQGLVNRYMYPSDDATTTVKAVGTPGSSEQAAAQEAAGPAGGDENPISRVAVLGGRLLKVAVVLGQALLLLATLLLLLALKPAVVAVLRLLVRSRTFWLKGLQSAYFNPKSVTSEVVDAYRLPQLVRGWESGMFMFLTSRLASSVDMKSVGGRITGVMSSIEQGVAEDDGLAKRLGALVRRQRLPIMIIHGVHDKLVPASNSQRLAAMLPGCELVIMQQCGHMPQEEWPQPFVELVREFVQRRAAKDHGKNMQVAIV